MSTAVVKVPAGDIEVYQPAPRHSFADMQLMSEAVAKSGLFKMTGPQVLTLMMLAESEGIHPVKALMRYHVYEGKPSMRSDAMQAEFQKAGGAIKWTKDTATECEATFTHPVHCPDGHPVSFTMEDAKKAGLDRKAVWVNHPRPMMRARVITNGIRMVLPGIIMGIYEPDEIDEFAGKPSEATVTLKATLSEKLKGKSGHQSVESTVQELKAQQAIDAKAKPFVTPAQEKATEEAVIDVESTPAPAPETKPVSGRKQFIDDAVREFNGTVPANGKPVTVQQVANAIITAGIESGEIPEDSVIKDGKRVPAMMGATLDTFWSADPDWIKDNVRQFLTSKTADNAPAPATREPGDD